MDALGIIMDFGGPVQVRRPAAGSYVKGEWTETGTPTTFTIQASVQPLQYAEAVLLPEGIRLRDAQKLYTTTPLQQAIPEQKVKGDIITLGSDTFQVFKVAVEPPPPAPLSHYKVIILRQPKDTEA